MSIKLEIGQADQLLLSFKYDEEIIKKVKTIKGRRWNSIQKKWVLPNNQNTMNEINKLFSTSEVIDCTKGNNKVEIITKDEVLIDMLQNEL